MFWELKNPQTKMRMLLNPDLVLAIIEVEPETKGDLPTAAAISIGGAHLPLPMPFAGLAEQFGEVIDGEDEDEAA